MTRVDIAKLYIKHLEHNEIDKVVELFSKDGIVHSPIYGSKPANEFYRVLQEDTAQSKLQLNGVFEESQSNRLAIYFKYLWTLKNGDLIDFDVVDIIVFDTFNKIEELTIIYDTTKSRPAIAQL